MALNDDLHGKKVQDLINDNTFITALVPKLTAGSGTNGVYTKTAADTAFVKAAELPAKAAVKAVVDAITGSSDFTNTVYTKATADTAFVKTAELPAKAAVKAVVDAITGSSDFTNTVYTKATADTAFVKTAELPAKAAVKAVVDAITASSDFTGTVYTKAAADTELAKKADADGTNLDNAKVTTILDKLTDKVVKTSELETKDVAEKVLATEYTDSNNKTRSVLVEKLGESLGKTAATHQAKYDGTNDQTAKDFLVDKYLTTKDVAEKVLATEYTDSNNKTRSVLVEKLGESLGKIAATHQAKYDGTNDQTAKDFLAAKSSFVKIDASNLTDAANKKAFAEAILPAKDGTKLVLADELGKALTSQDKAQYDGTNNQTVKEFLIAKGLKPTPQEVVTKLIEDANRPALANEVAKSSSLKADLAKSSELQTGVKDKLVGDQTFTTNTKTQAISQDAGFQGAVKGVLSNHISADDQTFQKAVREVTSQPIFEIPTDENAPISYDLF